MSMKIGYAVLACLWCASLPAAAEVCLGPHVLEINTSFGSSKSHLLYPLVSSLPTLHPLMVSFIISRAGFVGVI